MDAVLKCKLTVFFNLKKKSLRITDADGKVGIDSDYTDLRKIQLEKVVALHRDTFIFCNDKFITMKISGVDFYSVTPDHFDFDSSTMVIIATQDFFLETDSDSQNETAMLNYKDKLLGNDWKLVKDERTESTT